MIDLIKEYGARFRMQVKLGPYKNLDMPSQANILRRFIELNTPIPTYLCNAMLDSDDIIIKFEWHQAIKRYLDHFGGNLPFDPNHFLHSDTILLVDEALRTDTPLRQDYDYLNDLLNTIKHD